jgi:hypothetical protein
MPPSYPASVKTFPTRTNGTVIESAYVNEPGDEISAFEADILAPWETRAFNAAHYNANTGVLTVDAADVTSFAWKKIGKTMHVSFNLAGMTTGPAVVSWITIVLPAGATAARYSEGPLYIEENGVATVGYMDAISPGVNLLRLFKGAGQSYAANLANLTIRGSITLEVQ